jgi:hypothetical protein
MNDTIASAVVLAGILPEHRDAAVAYLESVRAQATQEAVQLYIDRIAARGAGNQANVVLSAALGRSYAIRGRDYYGEERWQYVATDGTVLVSYSQDQIVRNELGSVPKVTDADNPAWTSDPFPFAFVTVTGDVDPTDVIQSEHDEMDEDCDCEDCRSDRDSEDEDLDD